MRFLDEVIVPGRRRCLVRPQELQPYLDREPAWVVEAKSGEINMGVLGQALFGAQLVLREHPDGRVIPLAAAPRPPDKLLEAALDRFRSDELQWHVYDRLESAGRRGRSSSEPNPYGLREAMLAWYHQKHPGLLIKLGRTRRQRAFVGVRVAACGDSLAALHLSALLLPDRETDVQDACDADVMVRRSERVQLIHTCTDLYRSQMGKALFSAQIARELFGLRRARAIAMYRRDNVVLRGLLTKYRFISAVPYEVKTR